MRAIAPWDANADIVGQLERDVDVIAIHSRYSSKICFPAAYVQNRPETAISSSAADGRVQTLAVWKVRRGYDSWVICREFA
ncbi:MAG: hypothetical protein RIM84_09810 [Alphaproteobacteria bacterium]